MPGAPAGALAPSIGLPLRFVLAGVLSLLVGTALLIARPDILATYHYNQYVVATTHLFVLGFMGSIVMGAMYQLVPVALETRLYSERLGRWQFVLHLIGFAGMVAMFWVWNLKQVGHFGSVLAVGVALFAYNILRTLRQVPRWNVVAIGIASAIVWLSLGVLAGLAVAAAKCTYESTGLAAHPLVAPLVTALRHLAGFLNRFDPMASMHAHAHLGGLGFFVMMIVAVSYKLVPMFALSEVQNERRALASVVLLNASLAGLFFTILLQSPWKLGFGLLAVLGLGVYIVELRAILQARKRRRLDWGLKYFLTALGLLIPVAALGVLLAWPGLPVTQFTTQLENVYGFLALVGVIAFAILGFLHKIVPFLVWYHAYSPRVGRTKVPSLAGLYWEGLQVAGYWLYLAGLAVVSIATAASNESGVRAGCLLLGLSLLALTANLAKMLSHFLWPEHEPLPTRPPTPRQP